MYKCMNLTRWWRIRHFFFVQGPMQSATLNNNGGGLGGRSWHAGKRNSAPLIDTILGSGFLGGGGGLGCNWCGRGSGRRGSRLIRKSLLFDGIGHAEGGLILKLVQ